MRNKYSLSISDPVQFKKKLLALTNEFDTAVYLDSNQYPNDKFGRYDAIFAGGVEEMILPGEDPFLALKRKYIDQPDWYFGYFGYDLKNSIESLTSENVDRIGTPDMYFFRPKVIITLTGNTVEIYTIDDQVNEILSLLKSLVLPEYRPPTIKRMKGRMSKTVYLDLVNTIREHIVRGDLYEMNLCQEFYAEGVKFDPLAIFDRFNSHTASPFAAYLKSPDVCILCSSPERFMAKRGASLISQPIKGTNSRVYPDEANILQRNALYTSEKDRAENVMIVDLVRNDLARSCVPGSVQVNELFGIYTFNQVNQMISTVSGNLQKEIHFIDAIRNAFPMGSMTGAPKVKAMELIEEYELSKRGIYSGAIGYFNPNGDLDLNVVIRTMIYRPDTQYLSYHVGGAIVYDSDPLEEFQECLLKARGMTELFGIKL